MLPSQSNTQEGLVSFNSGEDLSAKDGYLVKMSRKDGTTPEVLLPTANTDITPYVVVDGGTLDTESVVQPLDPNRNVRVVAEGTGSAGDQICLADTGTAGDKGKIRILPALAATYRVIGIAEEDFVDGQKTLFRPYPVGNVVVS